MKKYSRTTRQKSLLLTSVSMLVFLAGCDFTELKNPFGSDRPPQVVEGERRQPIYNQQMMVRMRGMQQPAAAPAMPPMVMQAQPQPPMQPVAPMQPPVQQRVAPAPEAFSAPARPAQTQVYSRPAEAAQPMPSMDVAPPPPVQPAAREELAATQQPQPAQDESFFASIFSNRETTESANPPPWKMREGVQDDYVAPEPKTVTHAAKMPAPAPQAEVMQEPVAEKTNPEAAPAWADQWIGKNQPEKAPLANAPMDDARTAPYPALSSVPPRPEEFETAKTASRQNLQQMEDARATADQQRAVLSAEPSQQFKSEPVEVPMPKQAAEQANESYVTPAIPQQSMAPSYPGSTPRRGVDIMTQEEWEALKRGQPLQTTPNPGQRSDLGEPEKDSRASLQDDAASEPPSFFARVFGSLNTEHTDTNTPGAEASAQPAIVSEQTFARAAVQEIQPKIITPEDPRQQLFLPNTPSAHDKAAANELNEELAAEQSANGDWLMALVSKNREEERREQLPHTLQAQAQQMQLVPEEKPAQPPVELHMASLEKATPEKAIAEKATPEASPAAPAPVAAKPATSPEAQLLARLAAAPAGDAQPAALAKSTKKEKAKSAPAQTQLSLLPAEPASPAPAEPVVLARMQDHAIPQAEEAKAPKPEPVKTEQAKAEPEVSQPGWMSKLFAVSDAQASEPMHQTKDVAFGTQLATSASVKTEANPEPVKSEMIPAPAEMPAEVKPEPKETATTEPLPAQPVAQAVPAPEPETVVNRSVAEHNARLAAKKEMKLAKKGKGHAKETTLAKKDKAAPVTLAQKQPAPQPLDQHDTTQSGPSVTLTSLPTAPEFMKSSFETPADTAALAQATPVAPTEEVATTAPIIQTDPEIAQPAWFGKMFNGKQDADEKTAPAAVAVNENADTQKSANTAQNSRSPADAPASKTVNGGMQASASQSRLPSLSSVAAPITEVLTGQAESGLAASAASALPSPKILQEIKMLPTSRYSARSAGSTLQDSH